MRLHNDKILGYPHNAYYRGTTTIVLSLVASDLHGFTKLGRILFPFFPLILLTTLGSRKDNPGRAVLPITGSASLMGYWPDQPQGREGVAGP